MTPLERASRAVCASSLDGFCAYVGGNAGCKNGRGQSGGKLCVATNAQLQLAGHTATARAVIEAIAEPSQAMWDALDRFEETPYGGVPLERDTWSAMIDALLEEGR